jgi:hypothetical protein
MEDVCRVQFQSVFFYPVADLFQRLLKAYSCPCAAHFELRSFHDSGAWPPRTLELLRLCFCSRYSIPWVIPRRGVIVQRA